MQIKIFCHTHHYLLTPRIVALSALQSACYSRIFLHATMLPHSVQLVSANMSDIPNTSGLRTTIARSFLTSTVQQFKPYSYFTVVTLSATSFIYAIRNKTML